MRRRLPLILAVPAAALIAGSTSAPAIAASAYPTTPVPGPASPGQPPVSTPNGPRPLGHAVGDAGTGLAVLRLLPGSVTEKTILQGAGKQAPKQSAGELGFGLSSAQVNSESFMSYEHSIAESAPMGFAYQGNSPQLPGALAQTAPPDNPQPTAGGLDAPKNPLIDVGLLDGTVHARWSDTLGPCVSPLADASTSVASLSLLNAIPKLPELTKLSSFLDTSKLSSPQQATAASSLPDPLRMLGGLLPGMGQSGGSGTGSLVNLPDTLSSRSVVQLVDMPGSPNKAVQSTSTLQVATIKLLAGTPFEIDLKVVGQPTLQVTSTGDPKTSSVTYTAPVFEVDQGGKKLGSLNATNPKVDVPLQLVPASIAQSIPGIGKTFPNIGDLAAQSKSIPVIGNLAALLPGGAPPNASSQAIDLGVLRINIGQLKRSSQTLQKGEKGAPFTGFQLGATARMFDLQILPTDILKMPNGPSALAEVSLGEQVGRAYAPAGGVVCGTASAAAPPQEAKPEASPPPLAYTDAAYHAVPLFWGGTGALLAGVVLVAALPRRRRTGSPRR